VITKKALVLLLLVTLCTQKHSAIIFSFIFQTNTIF